FFICLYSLLYLFTDTTSNQNYTLSLHDALPIFLEEVLVQPQEVAEKVVGRGAAHVLQELVEVLLRHLVPAILGKPRGRAGAGALDRKSTRLNSSHVKISYAVFCLKKKNTELKDELFAKLHHPRTPAIIDLDGA